MYVYGQTKNNEMRSISVHDIPSVEPRESSVKLEYLIGKLSYATSEESEIYDPYADAFLCLANEIAMLKKEIETLKQQ